MSRDLLQVDRFLVAVEPPGPGRYLLDALWAPHGTRERLLRPLRRAPGGTSALLRILGAPPEDGWRRAVAAVEAALDDLGRPPGTQPLLLLRGYAHDRRERLTAFLFGEGSERPAAVLKLEPAAGEGTPPLARVAWALEELAERLPPELAVTVPVVLGRSRPESEWDALLVSALPGRPAYVELRGALIAGRAGSRPPAGASGHLAAAGDWLARFHRAAARPGEAWPLPAPEALGLAAPAPGWYRELAEALDETPLPAVPVHGDFWARNVLLGGPRRPGGRRRVTGVVDWEGFRPAGPPFEDLFHFPLTYGLAAPAPALGRARRGNTEVFRRTFFGTGRPARAVAAYARRWTEGTGTDPRLLLPLFRLFLRLRALRGVWDPDIAREPAAAGAAAGPGERPTDRGDRLPWSRFEEMVDRGGRRSAAGEERCVFSG